MFCYSIQKYTIGIDILMKNSKIKKQSITNKLNGGKVNESYIKGYNNKRCKNIIYL